MGKKDRDRKRRSGNASFKRRRVRGINSGLDALRINNDLASARIPNITQTRIIRTMEGASTIEITCEDQDLDLLSSPLLKEGKFRGQLDGLRFVYSGANFDGRLLTLKMEDEIAERMRQVFGPRRAYRDKMTRAEFILRMVRAVPGRPIHYFIKELHKEQPVANVDMPDEAGLAGKGASAEATSSGGGTIGKYEVPEPLQPYNHRYEEHTAPDYGGETLPADVIAAIAEWAGKVQGINFPGVAAEQVSRGESGDPNTCKPGSGRPGSSGVDPGGATKGWGIIAITDPYGDSYGVDEFGGYPGMLNPLACMLVGARMYEERGWDPWYGKKCLTDPGAHFDLSKMGIENFGKVSGNAGASTTTSTEVKRYAFVQGKDENAWDCSGRLAEEVKWARYASANVFYLAAEEDLLRGPIIATIDSDTPGVDNVSFEANQNLAVQTATITARTKEWAAPPGTVVELDKEFGPAEGLYLVSTIETACEDEYADVTIAKPTKSLPEPAPEVVTKTQVAVGDAPSSAPTGGASTGGLEGVVIKGTDSGGPDWGGSYYLFTDYFHPFMKDKGLSPGSQKRPYNTGSGVSDHYVGSTRAYATDYPTYSGEGIARNLAESIGWSDWQANSYNTTQVEVDGLKFQVQILWGSGIDHGDHVHVGAHRV